MDFTFSHEEEAFRLELRNGLEENLPAGWIEGTFEMPEDPVEKANFLG